MVCYYLSSFWFTFTDQAEKFNEGEGTFFPYTPLWEGKGVTYFSHSPQNIRELVRKKNSNKIVPSNLEVGDGWISGIDPLTFRPYTTAAAAVILSREENYTREREKKIQQLRIAKSVKSFQSVSQSVGGWVGPIPTPPSPYPLAAHHSPGYVLYIYTGPPAALVSQWCMPQTDRHRTTTPSSWWASCCCCACYSWLSPSPFREVGHWCHYTYSTLHPINTTSLAFPFLLHNGSHVLSSQCTVTDIWNRNTWYGGGGHSLKVQTIGRNTHISFYTLCLLDECPRSQVYQFQVSTTVHTSPQHCPDPCTHPIYIYIYLYTYTTTPFTSSLYTTLPSVPPLFLSLSAGPSPYIQSYTHPINTNSLVLSL